MRPYQKKTKPALWLSLPGRQPYSQKAVGQRRGLDHHKTPHKRRGAPGAAKAHGRKPIRAVSKTRGRQWNEYLPKKQAFLQLFPRCWIAGCGQPSELHHVKGRVGKLLLDERHWVPLCHCHHIGALGVHRYHEAAMDKGLLGGMGEWNNIKDPIASTERNLAYWQDKLFPRSPL